ncbi:MAG: apolipoprotein N-acyltransferase [Nitrospiraceae bacterium]|nr:apolipoprotein N-acyltransferase [Nitrospiraceae bacterium]
MRDSAIKKLNEFYPAVISGTLVIFAFPKADLSFLAWIALVPLLVSLWGRKAGRAFVAGYVFGVVYFFGTLYWIYHSINHFGGVSFPSSIAIVFLLCGYLSLYPAIFSYLFSILINRTKLPASLIAPVFWVVLEYVRSYAFTGFPWASLGYTQYRFLPIIQVADITGVYGISFLVIALNSAIVDVFILRKRTREMPLFPVSYTMAGVAVVASVLLLSLVYGSLRLGQGRPGVQVKASVIQGNIEQDKKWEPAFQKEVLKTYFDLSREAALQTPRLIVWPETSVPFLFDYDSGHTEELIRFQKGLGSYLLLGSVRVKERTQEKTLLANSAILLDPSGKSIYIYDKIHMVPFGEYVPLRRVLFFIDKIAAGIGDYIAGESYLQAGTDFGGFGTLICYEIIFPGMVRKFYTRGGDFMVTITNDAWFGRTAGPYQHFSMAVFRAVENRKPVIRAANTGVSGFIDSSGRILSATPLFTRQALTDTIKTDRTLTFYTKYGDLFSYLCIVVSIMLLINIRFWR